MRTRPLHWLLPLALACAIGGCTTSGACPSDGRSLEILAPVDGATVPSGDLEVVVRACGFERDDVIALVLDEPVSTDYGFVTVVDGSELTLSVPTLPGTMRMHAADQAARSIVSPDVSVSVAP